MPTTRQIIASSITRRYPFLSGCGTLANSGLVRLLAGENGDELTWARLDSGPEILVSLNDYVGRAAFYVGDLDRKVSAVISQIVRPGDHVLDIGANIGVVTLQLAKLVGKSGVVHSFEPNPNIAKLLVESIERNSMENVHVHTCALAEEGTLSPQHPGTQLRSGNLEEIALQRWVEHCASSGEDSFSARRGTGH